MSMSGRDPFEDQRDLVAEKSSPVIFDVGAHYGATALKYATLIPKSEIWAFEPYPIAFRQLQAATQNCEARVHPVGMALSCMSGVATLNCNLIDQTNSLLSIDAKANETWGDGVLSTVAAIPISSTTLDKFVDQNAIKGIDILKLDVQGMEHLVLEGGRKTIERGAVGVIYAEIITMPTYVGQMGLLGMLHVLEQIGYRLHNFYNISSADDGQMRQLDALFVHRSYSAGRSKGQAR